MLKRRKKLITILALLIFITTIAWLWSVWSRMYYKSPQPEGTSDEIRHDGKITNILILGIDQRADEPSRADTIIIMSINREREEVSLISIPRDSRIQIPGYGLDKINHAMAQGGIGLMRSTVEQLLNVPVHYYAYTSFTGFERIINTLGGVDVDVEFQIIGQDGTPIVQPGPQRLTGRQALSYVRFRSDREGDFGRIRRQQQVLKAMGRSLLQPRSVIYFPVILEQIARDVRTDIPLPQLLSLGNTLSAQNFADVHTIQVKGEHALIDGIAYVILDENHLRETVRRYIRWE